MGTQLGTLRDKEWELPQEQSDKMETSSGTLRDRMVTPSDTLRDRMGTPSCTL
jgi:hypothetical protein